MYTAVSERGWFFRDQGYAASETSTAWQEAWDHRSEKKTTTGAGTATTASTAGGTATATATATAKAATARQDKIG